MILGCKAAHPQGVSVKKELLFIAIALWWIVLLGWLGPALLSMNNTVAVLLGIAVILGSAYATYRCIRHRILNHKAPTP